MLTAMDKNHNNSQAENTYSLHQQKITLTNTPDEAVPLSHLPETAKPVIEAGPTLLSSVALTVIWILEFLSRMTRKGAKKKLKQLSFNGTVSDPKACSFQCCTAVPPSPIIMSQISQNISNNGGNDVNLYRDNKYSFCMYSVLCNSHMNTQINACFALNPLKHLVILWLEKLYRYGSFCIISP